MSEQNIYQEHYELQKAYQSTVDSLKAVHSTLVPLVAPHGVQITLQEALNLVVEKLTQEKVPEIAAHEAGPNPAHQVAEDFPE